MTWPFRWQCDLFELISEIYVRDSYLGSSVGPFRVWRQADRKRNGRVQDIGPRASDTDKHSRHNRGHFKRESVPTAHNYRKSTTPIKPNTTQIHREYGTRKVVIRILNKQLNRFQVLCSGANPESWHLIGKLGDCVNFECCESLC